VKHLIGYPDYISLGEYEGTEIGCEIYSFFKFLSYMN